MAITLLLWGAACAIGSRPAPAPTSATAPAADRHGAAPRHARALSCIGPACDATPGARPARLPRAAEDDASDPLLSEWHRFALNALLAPRVESEGPLRWSDESLVTPCAGSARVDIDGRPLVPGDPVPSHPFALRWVLDHCAPLGPDAFVLHGVVEMRVEVDGAEVRARVTTPRLVVTGHGRRVDSPQPFDATLSLGPSPRRE